VAVQYRTAGAAGSGAGRFTVPCVALSGVLSSLSQPVDFLKLDVEGAEYDMLFSLDDASLARIRRVAMEYHEGVARYSHADLARFFRDHGWAVRVTPSPVRPELGFLYAEH
jgi:hypothetical protein